MAPPAYDAVVDVDDPAALSNTDLRDDLEFHASTFKPTPGGGLPPPATASSSSAKPMLWSIAFYAPYFDVDTSAVLARCWAALYPVTPFLDVLDGTADLYGPFWIATTVVLILFLGGTISEYAASSGGSFVYNFRLLSGAAGLIYGYSTLPPTALWLYLRYIGSEAASLLECLALYGYANLLWILVALVAWSPWDILNWTVVAVGTASSGAFLVRNLMPVLGSGTVGVGLLHFALGLTIKFLFFAHKSPLATPPDGSAPSMALF